MTGEHVAMAGRRRGERGSLYLETLFALTVLGFALVAVAPVFLLGARTTALASDLTFATALAQEKAEALRALSYGSLAAGTGRDSVASGAARYERTWTVERDAPHPGMTTLTVTVEPQRPGRRRASTAVRMRLVRVP